MFRKLLIGSLVVIAATVAMLFAWMNPTVVTLDLAFASFDVSIAVAVMAGLVVGWLFGLGCMAFYVLKLIRQSRSLRKSLRLAEAEVSNLRGLPTHDAG